MMTQAFLAILDEGREEFRQEFAEGRAQMRANTEAVLAALDRLRQMILDARYLASRC